MGKLAAERMAKTEPADVGLVSTARVDAVMLAARQSGLLGEKDGRIGGRVSPALIKKAKQKTRIQTDTDLIEFALASVALEDRFVDIQSVARQG